MLWTDDGDGEERSPARVRPSRRQRPPTRPRGRARRTRQRQGPTRCLQNPDELRHAPRAVLDARSAGALSVRERSRRFPRTCSRNRVPQARLSPPPLAPESLVACAATATCRTSAAGRCAPGWRACVGLLEHRAADDLVEHDGRRAPAVLLTPILRDGIVGKALYFDDNNRGVLGTGRRLLRADAAVQHRPVGEAGRRVRRIDGLQPPRSRQRGQRRLYPPAHRQSPAGSTLRTPAPATASRFTRRQPLPIGRVGARHADVRRIEPGEGLTMYVNGVPADVEIFRDNLTRTIIPNGDVERGRRRLRRPVRPGRRASRR